MSNEDPLGVKIKAKIHWHHSEIKRLQAIVDEFEGGGSQTSLPVVAAKTHAKTTPRHANLAPHGKGAKFIEILRNVLKEGESLTSREIADRMKAAGYKSGADNYYATVYNQLVWWAQKGTGVVKVGDRSTGVLFRRK